MSLLSSLAQELHSRLPRSVVFVVGTSQGVAEAFCTSTDAEPDRVWNITEGWLHAHGLAAGDERELLAHIGVAGPEPTAANGPAAKLFGIDLSTFAEAAGILAGLSQYQQVRCQLFVLLERLQVDGDIMRGCHDAWKSCVVGDKQNGHLDAYDIYITNKKTAFSGQAASFNLMDVYARGVPGVEALDQLEAAFEKLKADNCWQAARADGHAWCECLSLVGVYKRPHGEDVQITVSDPCKEVSIVEIQPPVDGFSCLFSVKSCALHFPGHMSYSLKGRWTPNSPFGDNLWVLKAKLPGSISRAVREDAELMASLDGSLDFCRQPFRKLTELEWTEAMEACGVTGPKAAPPQAIPKAGYRWLCENGTANSALWFNAWPAAKAVVQAAKKEVLRKAFDMKQNILVSDTGAELDSLQGLVTKLKDASYEVCLLGIYADPQAILTRGIAREIKEGKRYNRSSACGLKTNASCAIWVLPEAMNEYLLGPNKRGDVYIFVEGGEDEAWIARKAAERGADLVPIKRSGGASTGLHNFPEEALQRPPFVGEACWALLADSTAPIAAASAAASAAVAGALAKRCREKQPAEGSPSRLQRTSDSEPPGSQVALSLFDTTTPSWAAASWVGDRAGGTVPANAEKSEKKIFQTSSAPLSFTPAVWTSPGTSPSPGSLRVPAAPFAARWPGSFSPLPWGPGVAKMPVPVTSGSFTWSEPPRRVIATTQWNAQAVEPRRPEGLFRSSSEIIIGNLGDSEERAHCQDPFRKSMCAVRHCST
eukprot:s2187_g5.t3